MRKVSRAKNHLRVDEIKEKIKETKGFWKVQKWLIIQNALVDPRSATSIATHVGVSVSTVHKTISNYNRFGPDSIEKQTKGGRRRSYMSVQEEKKFLAPFIKQASKGEITTIAQIQKAFCEKIKKPVHKTTIYRLLKRHGWKKLMPRPRHEKAQQQQQDTFKKTSRRI